MSRHRERAEDGLEWFGSGKRRVTNLLRQSCQIALKIKKRVTEPLTLTKKNEGKNMSIAWIKWMWDNKALALAAALAVVVVVAGLIIGVQHVNVLLKKADIKTLQVENKTLTTATKTMNSNAQAARAADSEMKKIQKQAEPLRDLAGSLTEKEKEGFNNEKMDRINDCLGAFFTDGVLPKTCTGKAVLPQSAAANVEKGRR